MTPPTPAPAGWDVEIRPHRVKYYAYISAALILAIHIAVAFLITVGSTGVVFRGIDQVAMALIGLLIAGAVLMLVRPRLRANADGLAVRNLLTERMIPWSDVVDVSFPGNSRWARVDLPHDEYFPLMAIQAIDGDRAVAAMDAVRDLLACHRVS